MHDFRVEDRISGNNFNVVCLKVFLTPAPSASPSIPLKRQKAVREIDFVVVCGVYWLDIDYGFNWVSLVSEMLVTR